MAHNGRKALTEEQRARLRRDPEVIVHRRENEKREPFRPALQVDRSVSVLELLDRCDEQPEA